jgi:hypothetical protein
MKEEGRGEGPSHRRPCLRPDRRRRAPAAAGDGELREELGVGRVWHRPCRPPRERRRGWGGFRVFCLYPVILEDAKMCFVGRAIPSWDVSVSDRCMVARGSVFEPTNALAWQGRCPCYTHQNACWLQLVTLSFLFISHTLTKRRVGYCI